MTIETITQQATLLDMAAIYAVSFGLFTPGALMAARQLTAAPIPVPVRTTQNAPRHLR